MNIIVFIVIGVIAGLIFNKINYETNLTMPFLLGLGGILLGCFVAFGADAIPGEKTYEVIEVSQDLVVPPNAAIKVVKDDSEPRIEKTCEHFANPVHDFLAGTNSRECYYTYIIYNM